MHAPISPFNNFSRRQMQNNFEDATQGRWAPQSAPSSIELSTPAPIVITGTISVTWILIKHKSIQVFHFHLNRRGSEYLSVVNLSLVRRSRSRSNPDSTGRCPLNTAQWPAGRPSHHARRRRTLQPPTYPQSIHLGTHIHISSSSEVDRSSREGGKVLQRGSCLK